MGMSEFLLIALSSPIYLWLREEEKKKLPLFSKDPGSHAPAGKGGEDPEQGNKMRPSIPLLRAKQMPDVMPVMPCNASLPIDILTITSLVFKNPHQCQANRFPPVPKPVPHFGHALYHNSEGQ